MFSQRSWLLTSESLFSTLAASALGFGGCAFSFSQCALSCLKGYFVRFHGFSGFAGLFCFKCGFGALVELGRIDQAGCVRSCCTGGR